MQNYVIRRIVSIIPILFVVSLTVFYITYMIPGNPAAAILGENATPEEVRALEIKMGLDQPAAVQYIRWLKRMVTGDLGNSVISGLPVSEQIAESIAPTISLTIFSTIISVLIALPLGIIAAKYRGSVVDHGVSVLSMCGISVPSFLLALGLMLLFSVQLRWFPVSGYKDFSAGLGEHLKSITLPGISLGFMHSALIMRMSRSSMLEVLGSDYIKLAKAKGVAEFKILCKHAFKNTLITMMTVIGQSIIGCLSGAAVVESVFGIPGMGQLIVNSIGRRDYSVIQGIVLLVSLINVFVNLLVDLLYRFVDPRIRLAKAS